MSRRFRFRLRLRRRRGDAPCPPPTAGSSPARGAAPVGTARIARVVGALVLATSLLPAAQAAGLSHAEAQALAREQAPALRMQQAQLAGSTVARTGADSLPDPRLSVGIENLPIAGMDRWSTTRDTGTMQRLALMQEVPNRAKRDARAAMAEARIERDRAVLGVARIAVQREAALAWLAVYHAERRAALIAGFRHENRLLQETLGARIAAMAAMPADLTMARQDALMIEDRADELARAVAKARAELRRWVGPRADEPLAGEPVVPEVSAGRVRERIASAAELRPFAPMRDMAAGEAAEMEAEERGDWSWEFAYSRRPKYDDMVSFVVSFDLPWQRERRQRPQAEARRREMQRIEAERDDMARRLAAEAEAMLAELRAMDAMRERLAGAGTQLAAERVQLLLAGYQAGRNELGAVLAARSAALETRMKVIELDAARDAMRVRLAAMVAEE